MSAFIQENVIELGKGWCNWARSTTDAEPLLMLHGVTRRWQTFLPLLPGIASRWQVHLLDFRGHGQSGRRTGHYRVVDYVHDAVALLTERIERPSVVYGHSLGAMVALAVAAEAPDLVRALILEDPPFETMGRRIGSSALRGYFADLQRLAACRLPVPETARLLAEIELIDPVSGAKTRLGDIRDPTALRFVASCLERLDPEVLAPVIAGEWLDGYDRPAILSRVRCPALLLQADLAAGGMLMPADAVEVASQLPDCVRVPIAGVGHLMHSLRTQEVLNMVHQFLESLDGSAGPSRQRALESAAYENR